VNTRPRGGLPSAAPEGLLACVLLAFLATAGLFYVNIMPALVAGLIDGLGFTNRQAGFVGSANVYGAACGALLAVFLVRRLPWRRVELVALSLLLVLDLVSTQVTSAAPLIALRFVHGVVGGVSVGIGLAVIARTKIPDRAFGMLLTVQYGAGGLGIMFLPGLAHRFGPRVLFLALAAFTLVTLLMLPFLAEYPPRDRVAAAIANPGGIKRRPLVQTLVAVFLFQAANMGLSAFLFPLGRHYGLADGFISTTLGVANWIGALGSIAVIWLAGRFGRTTPIVAVMGLSLAGTAAFLKSDLELAFIAANVVTAIGWSFLIPYFFGMCADFDPAGRSATLAGFFSKMGLASGPAVAALLLGHDNYPFLVGVSLCGLGLCALAVVGPARLLDAGRDAASPVRD
jgi:MFS transporter, DHA1 family, inner membrane transport protein